MNFNIVGLFIILSMPWKSYCQSGESYLRMVYVVTNTGQHTPVPEYYNEFTKLKSSIANTENKHELTQRGKEQMYILGARVRRLYSEFLKNVKSNEVNVTSMDNPGSQASAHLFKAGLLEKPRSTSLGMDLNGESAKENITIDKNLENSLKKFYIDDSCKNSFKNKIKDIPAVKSKFANLKTQIEANVGSISEDNVWKIYDIFESLYRTSQSIPSWLTADIILDCKEFLNSYMEHQFKSVDQKKHSAGVYIQEMVNLLDKSHRSYSEPKLRLFAADEMSFAAIVAALGGSKNYNICGQTKSLGWPKSGSAVIAELLTEVKTGDEYFKLFYWEPDNEKPEKLHINGCKSCMWYQYQSDTSNIRKTDTVCKA